MAKFLVCLALAAISLTVSAIPTKPKFQSGINGRLSGFEKLDDLYEVSWTVNEEEKTISFQVKAETKGWVGLGISPNGGMLGADLFIGGVFEDGTTYSSDYHGVGNTQPVEDTSIDWTLDEAHEDETHTYISFHRKLDTCDTENDIMITDGTMRVIWAVGAADDDLGYHGGAKGVKSVNFYLGSEDDFPVDDFEKIDITVETEMPAEHTTYWCTIHALPEFTEKRHVVAFEPILENPDALEHTHHFIFHRCIAPEGQDPEELFGSWTNHKGELCYGKKDNEQFPFDRYCSGNMVYTWSKGGKRMVFPDDIGFPIPENVGVKEYYALEVHYDNPQNQVKTFKTGGRIYHTDKLRTIDAGLMVVQHNTRVQLTVPPKSEDFVVAGHCSGECTQNLLPETGITAFNVMLHAHLTGRKIKLRHFRGEEELEWVDKDDFYDFDFQQNKQLNKPKKIERGDQLTVECNYNTVGVEGDMAVIGGLSSHEEMCQAWVFYWPRLDIKSCGSYQDLDKHFELLGITEAKEVESSFPGGIEEYEIVKPDNLAGPYLESVSKKIDWTTELREKYQQEKRFGEQIPVCSGGLKRQIKLALPVKYPENLKEYVAPTDCPAVTDPPTDPTTTQSEETSTTPNDGTTGNSASTENGGNTSPESTETTTESSGNALKITKVFVFFSVLSFLLM